MTTPEISRKIEQLSVIEKDFKSYLQKIGSFFTLIGNDTAGEIGLEEETAPDTDFQIFVRLTSELFARLTSHTERKIASFDDDISYVRVANEIFELNLIIREVVAEFIDKGIEDIINLEMPGVIEQKINDANGNGLLSVLRPKMADFLESKFYTVGGSKPLKVRIREYVVLGDGVDLDDDVVNFVENIKSRSQERVSESVEDIVGIIDLINDAGYFTDDKYISLKENDVFLNSVLKFLDSIENDEDMNLRISKFEERNRSEGNENSGRYDLLYQALTEYEKEGDELSCADIWDLLKKFVNSLKNQINLNLTLGWEGRLGEEQPERVISYLYMMVYLKRALDVIDANFVKR